MPETGLTAGPRGAAPARAQLVAACRSCGGANLASFLDLGETPIANSLVSPEALATPDATYPLGVTFCRDCCLVQVTHELPAETIFSADYPYFSSYSDSLLAHSKLHAETLIESCRLDDRALVVEIASNDGYLLRWFRDRGIRVVGVEPTPGPAAAAKNSGIPTVEAFFGPEVAAQMVSDYGHADVVLANNVMAHVPDLNGFVSAMAHVVGDGLLSVENPSVRLLVEHLEFDTIYHEHFCYFSTLAVQRLFERHGLGLHDVQFFPDLHGGTLRWYASRNASPTERAKRVLDEERALGLDSFDYYARYGERVRRLQDQLRELLGDLRSSGATIAAYGAAAKGATLLNSTGLGCDVIDFVVDRNPFKQGKLMPGVRLPILDVTALEERKPDYTVLLAWNFADEIVRQQQGYQRAGGRFIVPVPEPRVVQ